MKFKQIIIATLILIFTLPTFALSQDNYYTFERMWPTLQQPWYFHKPTDAAIDRDDFVYITDTQNHRVLKFTADGHFVANWRSDENGNPLFNSPFGIATDISGLVYVTDETLHDVQIFDSDGQFSSRWRCRDKNREAFIPDGITIDNENFVYLTDNKSTGGSIHKFTADGRLVTWKYSDIEDEPFVEPLGIATDNKGFVYITDRARHSVHKFTSDGKSVEWENRDIENAGLEEPFGVETDGTFLYVVERKKDQVRKFTIKGEQIEGSPWGGEGEEDGQFYAPAGVAVNTERELVYIVDLENSGVQKLTSEGDFLARWGSYSSHDGEFSRPLGIAIHGNSVYVADQHNDRIQKFDLNGKFQWKSDEGLLDSPFGVTIDREDSVYVADSKNKRIRKFDSEGNVQVWKSRDIETRFSEPHDVAVDDERNIYVADSGSHQILKFDSDGNHERTWGGFGTALGEFKSPKGIAISDEWLYVVDGDNERIQRSKLSDNLELWEQFGEGQFFNPIGVASDTEGAIYVTDSHYNHIQKFSPTGELLETTGEEGQGVGQLKDPNYLCVDPDGKIYVADSGNNRVQVFRPADSQAKADKAIIIAGGGPYEGNHLWDATRMAASYAFRVLNYRGFSKENIHYLSEDTELDLDGDGEPDVDREASTKALREVVEELESENNTKDMVIYLVDHGGEESFRMSGTETLSAEELAALTDRLQKSISGTLILVYDACESGSFHSELSPSSGESRILITSTKQNESAYFIAQGSVSFSQFFWTHIFDGKNVADAFSGAKKAIKRASDMKQRPNMPEICEELAKKTVIGNDSKMDWEGPDIESADSQVHGDSVTVSAVVKDDDAVDHVWATIAPVSREGEILLDKAVLELPSFDMKCDEENDRCEGRYDRLNADADYQIVIHARDSIGNTSQRELPDDLDTGDLPTRKIIIISGASDTGLRSFMEENIRLVENALKLQSYSGTIQHLDKPEMKELEDAFVSAKNADTRELVLYMVGKGDWQRFHINDELSLSAVEFDRKLDQVQEIMPGMVTVIYDADYSGSFIPLLTPPEGRDRIVLTATSQTQKSLVSSDTAVSFSMFFWQAVSAGMNVRDAFNNAKNSLSPFSLGENRVIPQMDDNGDGRPNQRSDGQLAMNHTIGAGIKLLNDPAKADDEPDIILTEGETSRTIELNNLTSTDSIENLDVWAVLVPPENDSSSEIKQPYVSERKDRVICEDCFADPGTYQIIVYAKDREGEVSVCKEISVYKPGPDAYEDYDNPEEAKFMFPDMQLERNFYGADETDWLRFEGASGVTYEIEATAKSKNGDSDIFIEVCRTAEKGRKCDENDSSPNNKTWTCPEGESGIYRIKLTPSDAFATKEDTRYNVKIYISEAPDFDTPIAVVIMGEDGPVANAEIRKIVNGVPTESFRSLPDGSYQTSCKEGTIIEVIADGYRPKPYPKLAPYTGNTDTVTLNFNLRTWHHSADMNKDEMIDIFELLRVLQLLAKGAYSCDLGGEDGYALGRGDRDSCEPHDADSKRDWNIDGDELGKVIELFKSGGYVYTEDGFAPAM